MPTAVEMNDPLEHYVRVLMQQGRVQLDTDYLAIIAILIGLLAPAPGQNAYVPWRYIERIQTTLDRAGIPWRAFRGTALSHAVRR
jgi:hypothetical protein